MKKEVKTPSILKKKMKRRNNSEKKHKFSMSLQKKHFQGEKEKKQETNVIFLLQKGT